MNKAPVVAGVGVGEASWRGANQTTRHGACEGLRSKAGTINDDDRYPPRQVANVAPEVKICHIIRPHHPVKTQTGTAAADKANGVNATMHGDMLAFAFMHSHRLFNTADVHAMPAFALKHLGLCRLDSHFWGCKRGSRFERVLRGDKPKQMR